MPSIFSPSSIDSPQLATAVSKEIHRHLDDLLPETLRKVVGEIATKYFTLLKDSYDVQLQAARAEAGNLKLKNERDRLTTYIPQIKIPLGVKCYAIVNEMAYSTIVESVQALGKRFHHIKAVYVNQSPRELCLILDCYDAYELLANHSDMASIVRKLGLDRDSSSLKTELYAIEMKDYKLDIELIRNCE